jgi:hypothetical protein
MNVAIQEGTIMDNTQLAGTMVTIPNLLLDEPDLTAQVEIASRPKEIFQFLEYIEKPIQLPDNIKTKDIDGNIAAQLIMNFALITQEREGNVELDARDFMYDIKGKLSNASINNLYRGLSLSSFNGKMNINDEIITLDGKGKMADADINASITKQQDNISGDIDISLTSQLLKALLPKATDYISGDIPTKITYNRDKKLHALDITSDLRKAQLTIPQAGLIKAKNTSGKFATSLRTKDWDSVHIKTASLKTDTANIKGTGKLDNNQLTKLSIPRYQTANNDFKLNYTNKNTSSLSVSGQKIDISPLFETSEEATPDGFEISDYYPLELQADIDLLYMAKKCQSILFQRP